MSTQSTNPVQPTTSSLNPFNILGGLFSDAIELTKIVGNEVADIPGALYDGFNNGAVIHTANSEALKAQETTPVVSTPVQATTPTPTIEQINEEIIRLKAMKTALTEPTV